MTTHTAAEVVHLVHSGLARRSRGCLVLVPPGFDRRPDVASRIERVVRDMLERPADVVAISADSVGSDADFVDLLVRDWCASDVVACERWRYQERDVRGLPPQHRLKVFFQEALSSEALRVLVVRRFDKVFRCMSGPLLAVLRDLEHTNRLTAINTSVLSYPDLYRRRARHEPSFVSDYGQSHATLMLGPLDDEEAEQEWGERVSGGDGLRLDRAYFRTALSMSGRVPSLFSKAAAYADMLAGEQDLRKYEWLLRRKLAADFRRLIRYDDDDDAGVPSLAESIARIYWRMGTRKDVSVVSGHRWGELMLSQAPQGSATLASDALGKCAVEMLGRTPGRIATEVLYARGEYTACLKQLEAAGTEGRAPLTIAAEMMSLAFAESGDSLYFSFEVDWRRVGSLAREGMVVCRGTTAEGEFRGWAQIAEAMSARDDDGQLVLKRDLVRVGLRILAVRTDVNAVTAAYSAIPLVEDAIRTYLTRLHKVSPKGVAFADVAENEVEAWWNRGTFTRPKEEAPLSGASLVVLSAVLSARVGSRLFVDAADAMRVVEQLERRNRLGHNVDTPDRHTGTALADCAARLLDACAQEGGVDLSVAGLERWVRAPRSFLPDREWWNGEADR